ncbi:sodium:calcium antiporter [Rhodosalinus halophilus]|uniref:Sodium:calcium antiporter n=1 Tax=Rhodosalinus halophilus TaxID=2259333 RepID=A0A365UAW8_9RHOB|nr:sodium:calcium antiporter [Rhodosalinus halophilus]RBI86352.1 sodium:calcium antiporter [Rhodosalinus halophilus]
MFAALDTIILLALFAGATVVILTGGTRLTGMADRIADRTGLGEALVGGVLLGAATSLSGSIVSLTSALDGRASLAFSNGIGGIAAQTAFLAMADLLHRRANLEHAAAELANVFQGTLLMLLLSLPLAAWALPEVALFAVHPASVVLFGVYLLGVYASHQVREKPMWRPVRTHETEPDEPDEPEARDRSTAMLLLRFALLMLIMGAAGWLIAKVAGVLVDRLGLSASVMGALATAVVTSLPELVTTLAAVRRGALQLAVGGIIGGNTFDTLFLTISDVGYREGSLYHAIGRDDLFWLVVGLMLTAVLTLGQLYRQRHGPAGIGIESFAILGIYALAILAQTLL